MIVRAWRWLKFIACETAWVVCAAALMLAMLLVAN